MSKQAILDNIRLAISGRKPSSDGHYIDITKMQEEDLLKEYLRLQAENMSNIIISSKEKLLDDIKQVLLSSEAKQLLYAMDLPCDVSSLEGIKLIAYDKSVEENRHELFHIDTSIVSARCGVANLGIMGFVSSPQSPRLTSLITEHCIMLLDKKNIVRNLFEGVEFLKKQGNGILPTNMFFVAGPSRTADIELQTVFGVHGPRKTTTIIY